MNLTTCSIAAVTAVLVVCPVAWGATKSDLETASLAFEQSALRLGDSDERPSRPIKWTTPIFYVATNAAGSPTLERLAWAAAQRIAAIAGVPIEEVPNGDSRANFFVILTENEAPAAPGQAGAQTCYARQWWKGWKLTKVELYMNFKNFSRIDRCAIHEVLHNFGFMSHPHGADSILSYVFNRRDLTALDKQLIETLYDPRMTPGLPRADAAKLGCRILGGKIGASAPDIEALCQNRR